MEDKQKVYIKGNAERGDEVIKIITDYGGRNPLNYYGDDIYGYYYISPNREIWHTCSERSQAYHFIKEFYKEIKLPKWKPKYEEHYYRINCKGAVVETTWYVTQDEEICYKFGNCFRTKEEAEEAINKIKEVLNNNE